jgi:hypothetical protein
MAKNHPNTSPRLGAIFFLCGMQNQGLNGKMSSEMSKRELQKKRISNKRRSNAKPPNVLSPSPNWKIAGLPLEGTVGNDEGKKQRQEGDILLPEMKGKGNRLTKKERARVRKMKRQMELEEKGFLVGIVADDMRKDADI